jgi:tripartite ATP-independent transporter DctP family solute receptor
MQRSRIAALTLGLVATLSVSAPALAQRVLRFAHVYETSHPMHAASVAAAEHFGRCTQGTFRMEVFPASQLGSERSLNEQLRFGGVDVILTGQLFAANDHRPLAVGAAPYIFESRDQALAYRKSAVFRELMEGYNRATGQNMLAAGYFGAFNVSSNRPIHGPADMRGLRIRVPDVPLYMAFPRAVGANPTPVAFAEVYLALQQGVVEASVNPLPVTYAFRFYEVQRYVALTGHLVEYAMFVASGNLTRQLNAPQRACLQEAADLYADRATEAIVRQEDELRAIMTERRLIQFTDPDRAAFRQATAGVIEDLIRQGQFSRELVERVRAIR